MKIQAAFHENLMSTLREHLTAAALDRFSLYHDTQLHFAFGLLDVGLDGEL